MKVKTEVNSGFALFIDHLERDHRQAADIIPLYERDLTRMMSQIHGFLFWFAQVNILPSVSAQYLTFRPRSKMYPISPTKLLSDEHSKIITGQRMNAALNNAINVYDDLITIVWPKVTDRGYWLETGEGKYRWGGNQSIMDLVGKDVAAARKRLGALLDHESDKKLQTNQNDTSTHRPA
jgi:hypothetical protein